MYEGIKESDTGLSAPAQWDLNRDKEMIQSEQTLQVRWSLITLRAKMAQVAQCSKIINADQEDAKYLIHLKQVAKFVVGLGERCASTDIEEGMRVGYAIPVHYSTLKLWFLLSDPCVSLLSRMNSLSSYRI